MPTRPIGELCTNPAETRARAARREPVPCYRCIAWDGAACDLIVRPPRAPQLNPVERAEQSTLFPTPDTMDSHKKRRS